MLETLYKIAGGFRAFLYTVRGRTRWREPMIEEDAVPRLEAEGFVRVRLLCQICDHEEPGMIDPEQMERNFECGRCHQIMARVIVGRTEAPYD